jgi:hypothetical protein
MPLLSATDYATIAALRQSGYSFEPWGDQVLVRDDLGSVVGLFRDLPAFLEFFLMTAWPNG